MSWMASNTSGERPAPYIDTTPDDEKVADPSGIKPGRMVSNKKANRPYLAYAQYREERKAAHRAWEARKREWEERRDKGLVEGPFTEPDPTAEKEVDLAGFLKVVLWILVLGLLAGKFFVNSWTWGVDVGELGRSVVSKYLPPINERLFSEEGLAQFDGSDPNRPIYLAIDGDVYDVSMGAAYQPGGSYHHFAGVDAARAFATGCFREHRTHDLRGLTEKDFAAIKHWKDFYANHEDYFRVGRVSHRPIDPASPIPEDCHKAKKPKEQQPVAAGPQPSPQKQHRKEHGKVEL